MDIPACHTLARLINSSDNQSQNKNNNNTCCNRNNVRAVFSKWFNNEFNSMHYINVCKIYGEQMEKPNVVLDIIKMLRTIIDRNDNALNKSIENEFNKYLTDNYNQYPFQMVC